MSRGQGRCVGSSGEERLWQGTSPDISGAQCIKPGISALIALSCDPAIVSAWPLGLLGKGRRAWMTRALTEQGWMRTQRVTSTQPQGGPGNAGEHWAGPGHPVRPEVWQAGRRSLVEEWESVLRSSRNWPGEDQEKAWSAGVLPVREKVVRKGNGISEALTQRGPREGNVLHWGADLKK